MINFEIPESIKNQNQMVKMVAEQAMRPVSRELDENEHQRPKMFIDMTWPFTQQMVKQQVKAAKAKLNSNGSAPSKPKGPDKAILALILMIEQLSWGDAGQYLCLPHPMLGGAAVSAAGTPEQQIRFLSKFAEGDPKWGAMAITEPGAGSDNSSMRTTAVLDEETNEWVINGEKIFITSGKMALEESDGLCVVWATVDPDAGRKGIKSFVVEGHTPGITIAKQEHKLGIRASDTVALHFNNVRIPYDNLLGSVSSKEKAKKDKGFAGAMKTFDASRPAVAASAMGVARAALEFTQEKLKEEGIEVDYTKSKFECTAVEHDLMEMEGRYKGAWLLTLRATAQMAHGESNRLEASMSKYRAGEAVTWITQKSVELLGPMGYSREWLAEKWMRDAKINDIYEGTKQINQLIVARSILGYTRRELK